MADFVMPILGADMDAGTLVAWRKQPGDAVRRGDIVAEVETDKGLIEVEAFVDGELERQVVSPGTRVPVGTVLAIIRTAADGDAGVPIAPPGPVAGVAGGVASGAPLGPVEEAAPGGAAGALPAPPRGPKVETPAGSDGAPRARISPAARQRAAALHIDLDRVPPGPDGTVTSADVERAASAIAGGPAAAPGDRSARMRRAIGAAMSRSKREIPHFYLGTTIDFGPAQTWLAAANGARPVTARLLPVVALLKATALALRDVPELNGTVADGAHVPATGIHLGVAIALRGGGLVAPAIHDADQRSLDDLMAAVRDLTTRARAGTLRSSELSDGTITVTSLGEQSVETVFPVIFPPQVAIVGFGGLVERPWVVAGQVVPRPLVQCTLAADHRVTDGHRAARCLARIANLLQEPDRL